MFFSILQAVGEARAGIDDSPAGAVATASVVLAFQPLHFTNIFDSVFVLECLCLVLLAPCQSPASSRANAVHAQLFNGLNFNAGYSALFHILPYGGDFC